MAAQVGDGQYTGLHCPACDSSDNAMSMRVEGKAIRAICHRASCGFKYSNNYSMAELRELRPSRVRPYTGPITALDAADYEWLSERFQLLPSAFGRLAKSEGRYFLPIIGPEGTRRGWVSRRPWEGSPLWVGSKEAWRTLDANVGPSSPKSLTYMENDEPVMDWFTFGGVPVEVASTVVLVEDQISAMRVLCDTGIISVALLGTGMNDEKVAEIQRHASNILIALDADATGQSFSIARKWGQAFNQCKVVILRNDIKDSTNEEVRAIFGPYTS